MHIKTFKSAQFFLIELIKYYARLILKNILKKYEIFQKQNISIKRYIFLSHRIVHKFRKNWVKAFIVYTVITHYHELSNNRSKSLL